MSEIKVYSSFSGLISMMKQGRLEPDNQNILYAFGCMKVADAIDRTFNLYYKDCPQELKNGLMESLQRAEDEGRVRWKSSPGERLIDQYPWIKAKLEGMGVVFTADQDQEENWSWGIHSLRTFLQENTVPSVQVV